MATEFRCEKCGAMLSTETDPGRTIRCSNCKKKVAVPAGLAALPHPQMPEQAACHTAAEQGPRQADPAARECQGPVMDTMARAMPWVISLFFHVGLALILMFVAMVVVVSRPESELPPPLAAIDRDGPTWQLTWPLEDKSRRQAERRGRPLPEGASSKKDTLLPSDPGDTGKPVEVVLGRGRRSGTGGKLDLKGPGGGFFNVGPGGGGDPPGGGEPAHHIVYVIDRSGSMVDTFDGVRSEMLLSIGRLGEEQAFHVILFAKGPPKEMPFRRLVQAVRRNKEVAADFVVECQPGHQTDPIPALRRAFAVLSHADRRRPGKLIHFLSDGNFPDNAAVLAAVRKLNKDKTVRINTFLYGFRPPEAERVMQKIAAENGGQYKFVSLDE